MPCRRAGTIANPTGGTAGGGSTELFAAYHCQSTTCKFTPVLTAAGLPWPSGLELEGSVSRANTAGMRITAECRKAGKSESSETFVGAVTPTFSNGTSALHPSFLEFGTGSGSLEKEGSKGSVLDKFEGELKTLGYEEQELITIKTP